MTLNIDKDYYWFTAVPTGLPTKKEDQDSLDSTAQAPFKYMTGTQMPKGDKNFYSIMNNIILYGTNATYNQQGVEVTYTSIDNLLESKLSGGESTIKQLAGGRQFVWNRSWATAKNYWAYLSTTASNK